MSVALKNTGNEPLLLLTFAPPDLFAPAESFARNEYGDVYYDGGKDVYVYNQMAQRETPLPFYSGLLLPQKSLEVGAMVQLIYPKADFKVTASRASFDYLSESAYFAEKNVWSNFQIVFSRWNKSQILSEKHPLPLLVLKTAPGDAATLAYSRTFSFKPAALSLSQAKKKCGCNPEKALYSNLFGGWVLFSEGKHELFTSNGYLLLPDMDPGVFRDFDLKAKSIRVKLPEPQDASSLSKMFTVLPGDGMYTHGQFITVPEKQLKEFLLVVRKEGLKITKTFYFFENYYYALSKNGSQ